MGQTGTCGLIYILESKSYLLRQPLFPLGPRIRTHRITDPRWPALFFHSTNRDNGNYINENYRVRSIITLANRATLATTTLHR